MDTDRVRDICAIIDRNEAIKKELMIDLDSLNAKISIRYRPSIKYRGHEFHLGKHVLNTEGEVEYKISENDKMIVEAIRKKIEDKIANVDVDLVKYKKQLMDMVIREL